MMDEKCFALGKDDRCRVLAEYKCPGADACGFYKTRGKFDSKQRLANIRLRRLPLERQAHIAEKYYAGQMPWKEK